MDSSNGSTYRSGVSLHERNMRLSKQALVHLLWLWCIQQSGRVLHAACTTEVMTTSW